MSTLHPLPEPGTVEAFVIDVLESAAIGMLLHGSWSWRREERAERFLRWLCLCRLAETLYHMQPGST
jgi:hypothetical protein